ncbi:MAG: hypothetical protein ABJQ66_16555 [Paracoccaceae bacterium]
MNTVLGEPWRGEGEKPFALTLCRLRSLC